jgi:hypothetical protein
VLQFLFELGKTEMTREQMDACFDFIASTASDLLSYDSFRELVFLF